MANPAPRNWDPATRTVLIQHWRQRLLDLRKELEGYWDRREGPPLDLIRHEWQIFLRLMELREQVICERWDRRIRGTVCPDCDGYVPGHASGAADICTCDPITTQRP